MRSQTYGDKQREKQRRKKEEELLKKSNPQDAPTSETPTTADTSEKAPDKPAKKDSPGRRSA
jgi:hypothetical protein